MANDRLPWITKAYLNHPMLRRAKCNQCMWPFGLVCFSSKQKRECFTYSRIMFLFHSFSTRTSLGNNLLSDPGPYECISGS